MPIISGTALTESGIVLAGSGQFHGFAIKCDGTNDVTVNVYDSATEASGTNDPSSGPQVGQTTAFRIIRGYLNVTIPALGSCTSAYLYLYGKVDYSTTDFQIMVYEGAWAGTVSSAEWEQWDGWVPDGPHTGTTFVDIGEWSTSEFVVGWNVIELNAAGRAAVLAAQGGTLQLALISKEETDYSQPTDNEYVTFEGLAGELDPYLRINDPIGGGVGGSISGVTMEGTSF